MVELAGLIIIGAMFGLIMLYRQLLTEHLRTHVKISELKVMIGSLKHDLSLDRQGMDERFDEMRQEIIQAGALSHVETAKVVKMDGERTRDRLFNTLTQSALEAEATRVTVADEHKLTRRRIAEVKTRLADEEADDQKAKAKARRQAKKTAK